MSAAGAAGAAPISLADAIHAARAADDAWSAAGRRIHGKAWCNVRYTLASRQGDLAPLYAEFRRTSDEMHAAFEQDRAALRAAAEG